MTEETLSDKISDAQMQPQGKYDDYVKAIRVKDVKNFIKELKDGCCECHMHPLQITAEPDWKCWFCVILNKRAGKKLVKGGNQDGNKTRKN